METEAQRNDACSIGLGGRVMKRRVKLGLRWGVQRCYGVFHIFLAQKEQLPWWGGVSL